MQLSKLMCLKVSQCSKLLEHDSLTSISIDEREKIVLPLLVIQQYALSTLRTHKNLSTKEKKFLKKLILKSISANTNAARNAV